MKLNILTFITLTLSTISSAQSSQPTAHNSAYNITYTGIRVPVKSLNSSVESFSNIRYGQPTNGTNRFARPKPYLYPNNTNVQATKSGAACPQNTVQSFLGTTQINNVSLSEDCLNLLVVRPNGTTKRSNLPVMVWIYGGKSTPIVY
jgi:carboxylesterase type B